MEEINNSILAGENVTNSIGFCFHWTSPAEQKNRDIKDNKQNIKINILIILSDN